ncbi:MAG: M20/M25/M40 family metallo-hydrolase [Bacteroidia bacterium]|nr:MAG: M20/M25/M40 family metallo-hydrolase [Bacteroidia bacterium]
MRKRLHLPLLLICMLFVFQSKANNNEDHLAERLKKHVSVLASDTLEGRGLGTKGKIRAKQYIAEQFAGIGLESFSEDYFQHIDLRIGLARVPATNIIGYLRGSDPALANEYIVIGAHYDHLGYDDIDGEKFIFPGADDNASGVAAMIEIAAYFAANPGLHGRSLIFIAFDAEESGLLGARRFVENFAYVDTDNISIMFSLDMVGMYAANRGLHLLGMGTLQDGEHMAREIAEATNTRLRRVTDEVPGRTDTWPFGQVGIPSVHAFTGTRSPYHQPEDTYDLLDYEGMATVTVYLQSLILILSNEPVLKPSDSFERIQDPAAWRLSYGLSAHIGSSYHSYPDEFFRAKNIFAGSFGFFLQIHAGSKLILRPEFLYDYHGSQSAEGKYRMHSLTIPVNFAYYLGGSATDGFVKLYPLAGGYFRYNLSGTDGGETLDFDDLHPATEWGINAGIGMDVMRVSVSYTRRWGLTNISPFPETDIYFKGGYFSIGYRF